MVTEGQTSLPQELQRRALGLVVLESALMMLINVLAFIGNVLVCWAVYHNKRLRVIPNIYVVTLAISDALMAAFCMPLSVVLLITGQWPFSSAVCHFQGFFCFFCALYSLLLMTATAVNRYFRVVKPNLYRQCFKVKSTCISVIIITLFAAFGAGLSWMAQWATFSVQYGKVICFMDFETPHVDMAYMAYLDVFYISVPIGIITVAYYKIFTTIQQHNQEMNITRKEANFRLNVEEVKITKALFAAVLGFILCWGPIAIIDLAGSFSAHKLVIPREVFTFYIYLGFGSCTINPVIYGVMNRAFRAEFLRVFTFCRRKNEIDPHGRALNIRN
ncbi:5-hydroxytryptamine receptor 1-like [Stylophora pistillata]|uniref:5-hydroxytryptamine receptor 1-like n=1 Tax=Stylophora pistillata TaxID=50429 RepID=UPI000C0533E7|nr:5-hydroxytryptamine receptor 1-like [Stylophora pistillata]